MDATFIQSTLADNNNKLVLKTVLNQPYIERKELADQLGFPVEQIDEICQPFVDNMVVLELASQAAHNIESRVPRKVYLVNPEMEQTIKDLL
ncbi:hypothetical protein CVD25_18020 [Bacillus canaveralius]|uniref:Uncharacterized protein n=1 Tax=Bacillus canaveralius TaxID=1403243 RepID=A0A2N5GSQ7_9BACI|nr:hypothetical protein [Bacillus canaveralius]PLR86806.1 hypothetical protein CU635_00485 [Bacillus canaveralius]PLR92733.1 hypothetical protein CVD25_18020 [Bacillus canaveralius]